MTIQRYAARVLSPTIDGGDVVMATDYDTLAAKLEVYKDLCAAMYQMAGVVGAPERFLDALYAASAGEIQDNPIGTLLPTSIAEFDDPRGEVVTSYNYEGQIVGVTRQNAEGQILSVIAEPRNPDSMEGPRVEQALNNRHIGSNFDEVLKEDGVLEEVTATAEARVVGYVMLSKGGDIGFSWKEDDTNFPREIWERKPVGFISASALNSQDAVATPSAPWEYQTELAACQGYLEKKGIYKGKTLCYLMNTET